MAVPALAFLSAGNWQDCYQVDISLQSEVGKGSEFTLYIPVAKPANPATPLRPAYTRQTDKDSTTTDNKELREPFNKLLAPLYPRRFLMTGTVSLPVTGYC
ncbi:MAG: hypothetical protein WDO16_03450 [Bacteroidota bacterium]